MAIDNAIQVFSNSEFHVRTINDNGETWFVAKDVAENLGYKNPQEARAVFIIVGNTHKN